MTAIVVLVLVVDAAVLAVVAAMTRAYVRAAAGRRARRDACPFEDDDDEARPWLREAADVVRESLALIRLVVPMPSGWRATVPRAGRGPIVVLAAERALPTSSLLMLGTRLQRDLDASIHLEHGGGDPATRADRLAEQLSALAAGASGRPLVAIGHGAGGLVVRRAAAVVRAPGLRVVTIATAHGTPDAPAPHDPLVDRVDVTNLYSLHDAIVSPSERAYLPGAYNIALRDEGHFGIVLRRRPYEILRESLAHLAPHAVAS